MVNNLSNSSSVNSSNQVNGTTTTSTQHKHKAAAAIPVLDTTSRADGGSSESVAYDVSSGTPVLYDPDAMTQAESMALIAGVLTHANRQRAGQQGQPTYTFHASLTANSQTFTQTVTTTNNHDQPVPETVTESTIIYESKWFRALSTELADALNDPVVQKLKKKINPQTMDAIKNFLKGFTKSATNFTLAPAFGELGLTDPSGNIQAGRTGFMTGSKVANTADSVQITKFAMEFIKSGGVHDFVQTLSLSPADAKQLEVILNTLLLSSGVAATGNAMGLPGLGKQLFLQAQAFRGEMGVLTNQTSEVVDQATQKLVQEGILTPDMVTSPKVK